MISKVTSVILSLFAVGGVQAAELPAQYKESGKMVIANQPNYPPMEYRDPKTNKLLGVDIDLALALAKELKVEVEWADIGFEQMVSSLVTGRVDLIHSGMSDLPKRRDSLVFVDYMKSGAQFYTDYNRRSEFQTPTDFCGKTVGMSRRTSFPDEAKKWSDENCVAKGKPELKVVGTEGSADARIQLKQGRLDGAVQGSETLPYLLQIEENTYVIVGKPFTAVFQGIGFDKKAVGLKDAYASALTKLMASGEYQAIFDGYGLGEATLDGLYVNGKAVK
ncbi:ABC transporter substrate-binding protein [Vibrio sp. DW001]|uniref:ABC transporter substrate-binding protein n=1 Tax=Vibrio sp. DW001 TaxID=2912315 RepID=UPI0023AEA8D8|nr:ABC transporter substrate-binding protein [Vibrio sp. DW001]WED25355.1 ABC transporter substrate-binding protein [Vibrio sp. DW001]